MTDRDPLIQRIDDVLADEERARRAWIASTTPGASPASQRSLAHAVNALPDQPRPTWWRRALATLRRTR